MSLVMIASIQKGDFLVVPSTFALLSATYLCSRLVFRLKRPLTSTDDEENPVESEIPDKKSSVLEFLRQHDGVAITCFRLMRLFGVILLLTLEVLGLSSNSDETTQKYIIYFYARATLWFF